MMADKWLSLDYIHQFNSLGIPIIPCYGNNAYSGTLRRVVWCDYAPGHRALIIPANGVGQDQTCPVLQAAFPGGQVFWRDHAASELISLLPAPHGPATRPC
jgi:hypothetical protein